MSAAEPCEMQVLSVKPCLNGLTSQLLRDDLEHAEDAGDGNDLRVKRLAKHARVNVAAHPRHRAAAQWPINMNAAIGDHLGAGADCRSDHQVPIPCINALARTNHVVVHEAGLHWPGLLRGLHRLNDRYRTAPRLKRSEERQIKLARRGFHRLTPMD